MSGRAELERRQAELLARCATEREAAAATGNDILVQVECCDARLAQLQRWLSNPLVLGAGFALAWMFGRGTMSRRLARSLGLLGGAMRLRALL